MATVWLARDLKHERRVAIKVIRPELSAILGGERFLREIALTAQLQHPHMLPLIDSGAVPGPAGEPGVLYYVMPYVEGESLRQRLAREGPLPLDEVRRLTTAIAAALDYAHGLGIIHRDVKPENILLYQGEPMVADFGIALATGQAGRDRLTETGLSLGTPAYMSPEQATAEPRLDGRSDQYSLACVVYEMLTGEPPYTGASAQAIIAKRLSAPVPSVRHARPAIPEATDLAVRRAMALTPADRFPSVAAFASALTPTSPSAGSRKQWLLLGTAAGAALIVLLVLASRHSLRISSRATPALDARAVTILPFRVAGAAPSLAYLREGMVDLLAAKLSGGSGPRAVDPRTVLSAWRQAGGSAKDDLARPVALSMARQLGAGRLIEGSVVGQPERLVVTAALLGVTAGLAPPSVAVEGPLDSLSALIDRLTARLLAGEAGQVEKLAELTSTSLPALRAYLEGRSAYRHGRYLDAVRQFGRALDLDSTFALAGLDLHSASGWTPNGRGGDRGLAAAWANRDRLSRRDRLFLVAKAGPRYPAASSFAERLHAWEQVLEVAPDQPEAQQELGEVLFHYGATFEAEESHARAARAFARAVELDSSFASPLSHLIDLAAANRDTVGLRHLGGLYLSRYPGADDAVYVRWRLAAVAGDTAGRRAIRSRFDQLAEQQVSNIAQMAQYDGMAVEDVRPALASARARSETNQERWQALVGSMEAALNMGRPTSADSFARLLRSTDDEEMPNWSLDWRIVSALFWDADSVSAADAIRSLGTVADKSARGGRATTPSELMDLCIGQLWRSAHHEAGGAEHTVTRPGAGSDSIAPVYPLRLCAALLSLRETPNDSGDPSRKLELLDSLVMTRGESGMLTNALVQASNLELARRWAAGGDLARARRALDRRIYFMWDLAFLSTALREKARLAALAGDRSAAIRAYEHYLALRFDPEPSQRADMEQARWELAKLVAGGGQ
jgi:serine/threonine-protein kinase